MICGNIFVYSALPSYILISVILNCGRTGAFPNISESEVNEMGRGQLGRGLFGLMAGLLGTLAASHRHWTLSKTESHTKRPVIFKKYKKNNQTNGTKSEKIPEEGHLCSQLYWNVDLRKPIQILSENFGKPGKTYSPSTNCTVLYQGSRSCTPTIKCNNPIKLRPRLAQNCQHEFLRISDGLGGDTKYCDKDAIAKVKPSNYGKDLFVQFVTGPTTDPSNTGFSCTATCLDKNEDVPTLAHDLKQEKKQADCVCGVQSRPATGRIVGGVTGEMAEFPWLVPIVLKDTRQPVCAGAIINDRHVLTAAHCFVISGFSASEVEILVHAQLLEATITGDISNAPLGGKGSVQGTGWNMESKSDADENSTRYGVDSVIIHPMFTEGYDNDIAVMKLSKKIEIVGQNGATPICLPNYLATPNEYDGGKTVVAGWGMGHEDAAATNRLLQKLENVPIIDREMCQKLLLNDTVTERMLCAGFLEGGKDACTGDSGGPLILKGDNDQYTQVGIVSWGSGCAQKNSPGVYTNLQEMMEWLNFYTMDPNVEWCAESFSTTN